MAILIRTSDIARRASATTHGAASSAIRSGRLTSVPTPDVPLWGEIGAGTLGPVNVGSVLTSTPHSVHRTPGLIRRGSSELYRVVLAMSGGLRLAQDDKTARLRPGEFAIYDFARPYELVYDSAVGWRSSASRAICWPSPRIRPRR